MAGLPELDAVKANVPDELVHDRKLNSAAAENGLSVTQRHIIKNVYDTQPKLRRAFVKQLGYELSEDGESYRPLGKNTNYTPIEPVNFQPNPWQPDFQPIPYWKMLSEKGLDEVREEFGRDALDVSFDTLVSGPAIGLAGSSGMVAGAAKGTPIGAITGTYLGPAGTLAGGAAGAILGGATGLFAGGFVGNAAAETAKLALAEALLDEAVPIDLKETFYQSVLAGGLSVIAKGGAEALRAMAKVKASDAKAAYKEILNRKADGRLPMPLVEKMVSEPQNFTPAAVADRSKSVNNLYHEMFGTDAMTPHTPRNLQGGVVKDAIQPLNELADLEIQKLSKMPEANTTVEDLAEILTKRTEPISQQRHIDLDTEQPVLDYVKGLIDRFKANFAKKAPDGTPIPGQYDEVPFGDARKILKEAQNAAWNSDKHGVKGNPVMIGVSRDLKELMDAKAGDLAAKTGGLVSSNLPEINKRRSAMLKTYETLRAKVTPSKLDAAYLGEDKAVKEELRNVLEGADRILGTNLAGAVQTAAFNDQVKRFYENPKLWGNKTALADAFKAGADEAFKRGREAVALTSPIALAPGGIKVAAGITAATSAKGFAKGAAREFRAHTPNTLMKNISKIQTRLSDLDRDPVVRSQIRMGQFREHPRDVIQNLVEPQVVTQAKSLRKPQEVAPPLAPPAEGEPQAQPAPSGLPPELESLKLQIPDDL